MRAITVVGLMALLGAGAGVAYLLTRKKRTVIQPTGRTQPASTPWTFQLPALSKSYQLPDAPAAQPTQTPTAAPVSSGSGIPANNYVMADRRNQPTTGNTSESTSFLDSMIKAFEPKPAISLLRPPEPRAPATTEAKQPSILDSIFSSFAPSMATPTQSRGILPQYTATERRTIYQPSITQRPAVSAPAFDDSPLAIIESAVKAIVEPVVKIVQPIEAPVTVSAGMTESPVTKFERDVGFTRAFTTSDGKRWLVDYRNAQYLSDEFHRSAAAVADAAARSKRDGRSYSPG